jgi:hypothetical protein
LLTDLREGSRAERVQSAACLVSVHELTAAQLNGISLELASSGFVVSALHGIERAIQGGFIKGPRLLEICALLIASMKAKTIESDGDDVALLRRRIVEFHLESTRLLAIAFHCVSCEQSVESIVEKLRLMKSRAGRLCFEMGADELFAIEILYLIEREKWLKSAHMFNSIYVNKSLPHSLSEPGLTVMKEIISRFVINDLKAPPMDYAAVNLLRDPGSNLPDNIDVAFTILGILGPDSYLALTNNIG